MLRRFGLGTFAVGLGWFVLSIAAFAILLGVEKYTGTMLVLPSFGGIEWVGLLLYFGLYFGSWFFMLAGGALVLLATVTGSKPD